MFSKHIIKSVAFITKILISMTIIFNVTKLKTCFFIHLKTVPSIIQIVLRNQRKEN